MKKLKCRDLGGPCDAEIVGDSFQEMEIMQAPTGDRLLERPRAAELRVRPLHPAVRKLGLVRTSAKFAHIGASRVMRDKPN